MILASCRKNFTDTMFHAPLSFRQRGDTLSWSQALDELAGQHVDILIHGYKNSFESAYQAYQAVDGSLTAARISGRRVGFFWCGSWAASGFWAAKARTKRASFELAELITRLNGRGCRVTVETHSLGARVALKALALGAQVERLILTAAAVNRDVFCEGKEFAATARNAGSITVMWSKRDGVLRLAYRLASRFATALGLAGPQRPHAANVTAVDLSGEVAAHGGYKNAAGVFQPEFWRS